MGLLENYFDCSPLSMSACAHVAEECASLLHMLILAGVVTGDDNINDNKR